MATQIEMDTTAVQEGANGAPARRSSTAFFLESTPVFAVIALLPVLALGFAITWFLSRGIGDLLIGAGLVTLYVAIVHLGTARRRQAELQDRTAELKTSYDSIVAVLCAALDLRDNVTHGHARRVSRIASVLAWQMGLRKGQLREIEKAAILHDIGKIGVADAVLSKPGPLDDSEWTEMKRHPELGFQILSGIDFLSDAAEVVYAHHERYDGSGYPRGLKGEKIPLGARIFAVVDAYDAMTSHRPYRKALPHRNAIEEIVRNAGTQFDPEVVRAFLEAGQRGLLDDEQWDDDREVAPAAVKPSQQTLSATDP